jgi:hypothetical protein
MHFIVPFIKCIETKNKPIKMKNKSKIVIPAEETERKHRWQNISSSSHHLMSTLFSMGSTSYQNVESVTSPLGSG